MSVYRLIGRLTLGLRMIGLLKLGLLTTGLRLLNQNPPRLKNNLRQVFDLAATCHIYRKER